MNTSQIRLPSEQESLAGSQGERRVSGRSKSGFEMDHLALSPPPLVTTNPRKTALGSNSSSGSNRIKASGKVDGLTLSLEPKHVMTGDSQNTSPVDELISPGTQQSDNLAKEKKKGVSFLSRFGIIGGKKKDFTTSPVADDDASSIGDARQEGMNASVFTSSIGANGFTVQHKAPPEYIKVRASNKPDRDFNRIFLAQEFSQHAQALPKTKPSPKPSSAVWSLEFSKDGRYLAAAGRDQVVRVWAVISTPEERQSHEHEEDDVHRLHAPVFRSIPIREFEGHTGEILDLSWSKNGFLLSSSMDKTVRLWHVSRQECLCTFTHKEYVTSVAFHPTDDRFFLAGSIDSILRLWSIPDKSVAFWTQLPDLITAVAFTPDGRSCIAGVLSGLCLFYETEGLKYHTQIHVRSSRGKNARGSKITGIRMITYPPESPDGDVKILITSNDSRVRVYNMRDKSLEMKFKGHQNTCTQINASFSDDGKHVICGSEDGKAHIWSTIARTPEIKNKLPLEVFEAHSEMVTAAIMAPTRTRILLSASGDPIYDLCNPPPIVLMSREEAYAQSMPPTPRMGSMSGRTDATSLHEPTVKKTTESPAYKARRAHLAGPIIITADYAGKIKVFRQDCAFSKRRQTTWDSGSGFSKKMLGRTGSIATKGSAGSYSHRGSASQSSLARNSPTSDQIVSWRNAITTSSASLDQSIRNVGSNASPTRTPLHAQSAASLASAARAQPYGAQNAVRSSSVADSSPAPSMRRSASTQALASASQPRSVPPTPGFSFQGPDDESQVDVTGHAKPFGFWNLAAWKQTLAFTGTRTPPLSPELLPGSETALRPDLRRSSTIVSKLSSDETSAEEEDGVDGNGDGKPDGDAPRATCLRCGAAEFRAGKVLGGKGIEQQLECRKCGAILQKQRDRPR